MIGALRSLRGLKCSSRLAGGKGHGNALQWYAPNLTPEARHSHFSWRASLMNKEHHDMGEWTKKNLMLYPPQKEGEPPRPMEIYWGRAQIAANARRMHVLCLSLNNLDIEEAIALCYNMKLRTGTHMYEVLREAKDFASREVSNPSNMHVAECFALKYQDCYHPGQGILRKQNLTNVYVLLREGPAPPPRKMLTTEDAVEHYLQVHRDKEISHTW